VLRRDCAREMILYYFSNMLTSREKYLTVNHFYNTIVAIMIYGCVWEPASGVWQLKRDVWGPSPHQLSLNLTHALMSFSYLQALGDPNIILP